MIIYNSKLAKLLKVSGITLFPFIFISLSKEDTPAKLIRHEKIHIKQQIRWFIIPFYVVYIYDYIYGRINGLTHWGAYRNIRFELEAYDND